MVRRPSLETLSETSFWLFDWRANICSLPVFWLAVVGEISIQSFLPQYHDANDFSYITTCKLACWLMAVY